MIRIAPITTELLGISLKNKYPISPTNMNDVYSKGELIDVDESPAQGQPFSVKRHVEPPKVAEPEPVQEKKEESKSSEP